MPTVYSLELPDYYLDWTDFMKVFEIDWSNLFYPGACVGSFERWLLLRSIGPLALAVIIAVVAQAIRIARHVLEQKQGPLPFRASLIEVLPVLLFIAFCFASSTSTAIFAAWSCATFESDSLTSPPSTQDFLRGDLSVKCDRTDSDYTRIINVATVLVVLWPIGERGFVPK